MRARIERLQPGEGERWRRIRLSALAEAPYAFGTTYAEAVEWPSPRWELQITEFATFIAVVDGRDVGVVRGATHESSEVRELISLWVAPSARRRGVAQQLIESVAGWAAGARATLLVLDVVADNVAATALYEGAGFRRFDGEQLGELTPGEIRLMRSLERTGEDSYARTREYT